MLTLGELACCLGSFTGMVSVPIGVSIVTSLYLTASPLRPEGWLVRLVLMLRFGLRRSLVVSESGSEGVRVCVELKDLQLTERPKMLGLRIRLLESGLSRLSFSISGRCSTFGGLGMSKSSSDDSENPAVVVVAMLV